ncbi:MAG: FtsW/RodA/SpoVE family cell cycle protein, partial [Desulfobacterales bacterium]
WAGYTTTTDDRSLLAGKIAELERSRLLIETVGSFAPVDSVYDLSGNVAEWFVTDEGTGGIWGAGIGKGYQKLFYLPEPHTDFIFSVIGEELGLIGVLVILGLYTLILWRGISIARNSPDAFGSFVAVGLTTAMGLQIFINMGVALGLLPTKGLTLPFLSYGGTSLLMNMASIGVLMNISGVKKMVKAGR